MALGVIVGVAVAAASSSEMMVGDVDGAIVVVARVGEIVGGLAFSLPLPVVVAGIGEIVVGITSFSLSCSFPAVSRTVVATTTITISKSAAVTPHNIHRRCLDMRRTRSPKTAKGGCRAAADAVVVEVP